MSQCPIKHEKDTIEIHPGQLYFKVTSRAENTQVAASSSKLYINIDNELIYEAFANDFGPLHLGCSYRFCRKLSFLLKEGKQLSKPVVFSASSHPHRKANAAVLLGIWLVVFEDYTADEAYSALQPAEPFLPFRDASCGPSQFDLTVKDVLAGISKAKSVGFIDWHLSDSTFNLQKYEFFEQITNGDINWIIPGKFLAFSGPICRRREHNPHGTLGVLDYVPIFKKEKVVGIVRLNKMQYDKRDFTASGLSHYDLYFPDGTCPPVAVLQNFLNIAEKEPGALAVHCKAGLGRTGTLIGCYMMKHYGFTAAEVIGYTRVVRPGSILGPQQLYLHDQQSRMWAAGAIHASGSHSQPSGHPYGAFPASSMPSKMMRDLNLNADHPATAGLLKLGSSVESSSSMSSQSSLPGRRSLASKESVGVPGRISKKGALGTESSQDNSGQRPRLSRGDQASPNPARDSLPKHR